MPSLNALAHLLPEGTCRGHRRSRHVHNHDVPYVQIHHEYMSSDWHIALHTKPESSVQNAQPHQQRQFSWRR